MAVLHVHPPTKVGEYFEAGTLSIILMIVAVLSSTMVQRLRQKQDQLENTSERLLQQEKMAAVGRLSSAMAHEIRNPVAMISSALATAKTLDGTEREQMLEIARLESSRLAKLTNDSWPMPGRAAPFPAEHAAGHRVVRRGRLPRARRRPGRHVKIDAPDDTPADYDEALLQQVLMNRLRMR